jgi:hypothetical protein
MDRTRIRSTTVASVTARKSDGGKRERGNKQSRKGKPKLLDSGEVISVVDEIDFIEMVLATLPMLRVLACKIEQYRDPREDPRGRDEIVRLGMRLSGFDVDSPRPRKGDPVYPGDAVHPHESNMMSDVAMGIEAVVEALRWRLQRLSLVLMAAVESQPPGSEVNKSTSQK